LRECGGGGWGGSAASLLATRVAAHGAGSMRTPPRRADSGLRPKERCMWAHPPLARARFVGLIIVALCARDVTSPQRVPLRFLRFFGRAPPVPDPFAAAASRRRQYHGGACAVASLRARVRGAGGSALRLTPAPCTRPDRRTSTSRSCGRRSSRMCCASCCACAAGSFASCRRCAA
jgi:hypothetical protein